MTDMMKEFDENAVAELKEETPLNLLGAPEDIACEMGIMEIGRAHV